MSRGSKIVQLLLERKMKMASQKDTSGEKRRLLCQNRRARHDYAISETWEAGLVLVGSEVKALREGRAHLTESYVKVENGQAILIGAHIAEYNFAHQLNHVPTRPRVLLLHERQIRKLHVELQKKGMVAVPLALYFNEAGKVKVSLGIGKGKAQEDRRASIKERDLARELARSLGSNRR